MKDTINGILGILLTLAGIYSVLVVNELNTGLLYLILGKLTLNDIK